MRFMAAVSPAMQQVTTGLNAGLGQVLRSGQTISSRRLTLGRRYYGVYCLGNQNQGDVAMLVLDTRCSNLYLISAEGEQRIAIQGDNLALAGLRYHMVSWGWRSAETLPYNLIGCAIHQLFAAMAPEVAALWLRMPRPGEWLVMAETLDGQLVGTLY